MAGMEEHTNLVNQGTVLMLNRVLKDLQVSGNIIDHLVCTACVAA